MRGVHIIAATMVCWTMGHPSVTAAEAASIESLLERGTASRDRGDIAASVEAFERAASVAPDDTDVLLHLGLAYAQSKRCDDARETLSRAIRLDSSRLDLRKALARSELWAGRSSEARLWADTVIARDRSDVEGWLLSAQTALAQNDVRRAKSDLSEAESLSPLDEEVLTALTDLKVMERRPLEALAVLENTERHRALTARLRARREQLRHEVWRWRYAANLSRSNFSSDSRDDWREAFQQLDWRWSDDVQLQARVETSERFAQTDTFVALGVQHRFSSSAQGYLQAGGTPNADFRERRSLLAGTSLRFDHDSLRGPATLLALDLRLNEYATGHVETYQPGIEQYFSAGRWWLSARGIVTNDERGIWQNGWQLRADVATSARWSAFVGYSDAPETSGNVTMDSRTPFGGVRVSVTGTCNVSVAYAREDRPAVYVRDAWTAGMDCSLP